MSQKNWTVRLISGTTYKVINHETGKDCVVDVTNDEQRNYAFKNMEKVGFNKTERGKIYDEIYKKEEGKKPKKSTKPDIKAIEFIFEQKKPCTNNSKSSSKTNLER